MAANLSNDVRKYILTLIQQGISSGNDKLPKERSIAAAHGASYGTVRLVTQQLEAEGFIRKVRGSGTYILPEAARLLRQSTWRRLWYFHSPGTRIRNPEVYQHFLENFGERRTISIPWWTLRDDGKKSKMPRNCTLDFKVDKITQYVRWELLGYKKGQRLKPEDVKGHQMHMGATRS